MRAPQIGADTLQRRDRHTRAEVVEHEPTDRRTVSRGDLHADVAAERGTDPVDFIDIERAMSAAMAAR
jgi:hypothetical protein